MDSWLFLPFPRLVGFLEFAGPEETKNPAGKKCLRLIQIRLATLSLQKILAAYQAQ
jgi:hypothetical protein